MRVPFFDMRAELALIRSEIDLAIGRVLDSGVFVGGPEVTAFERELAVATGASCAVGVSSGTDALHAIAMALGIGAGDEVVTTPFSFAATATAFARTGAKIVFADIDDTALNLDPARVSETCTRFTKAIVSVNLFGHPAPTFEAACPIVEDRAHGIGATRIAGVAAALSFFPTKNLGALGDGGAVLTDDAELADRVALLRSQGARPKYHHLQIGGNFRLDTLQAAILRTKLPHLGRWTAARRTHAARYREAFAGTAMPSELRLPASVDDHVYHQFVIRVPERDALRAHLAGRGIGTEIYYPVPLHLQPCFASLGYVDGDLPIAERASREVLALPIHPALAPEAPAHIVAEIRGFYRGR